ncbi:hypothetical protein I4U23_022554 [Adineta vaga]|nr:hypothetical protein I4U23_022554 [Adineta vaga]
MDEFDEILSTIEPDTNVLVEQPPRFSLRPYLSRSTSTVDLVGKCCGILSITFVFLGLIVVFPTYMIVVGSTNIANCPIETKIPIYLIVTGSIPIVSLLLSVGIITIKLNTIIKIFGICLFHIQHLLHIFWITCIIFGLIWMVNIAESVQHTNILSPTYCDKNVFIVYQKSLYIQGAMAALSICYSVLFCALSFGCIVRCLVRRIQPPPEEF